MYCLQPCDHRRNHRPSEFMNDLPKTCVLLGRPADDCKGPDRVVAVPNMLDLQYREQGGKRERAQVTAKRSFGQLALRIDGAGDAEIRVSEEHASWRTPPVRVG